MEKPLKNDAAMPGLSKTDVDFGPSGAPATNTSTDSRPANVWKPVVVRVVLSGLALLGLAGVGAASMLAGLDGARANSPQAIAARSASHPSAIASAEPAPSASAVSALPAASSTPDASAAPAAPACAGRTPDGKVILNLATIADLRTLPGIGQKRADAILVLRDKLKHFKRIQELRRVRGIGAKTLMKLAPKLLVDPPPGTCDVPKPAGK